WFIQATYSEPERTAHRVLDLCGAHHLLALQRPVSDAGSYLHVNYTQFAASQLWHHAALQESVAPGEEPDKYGLLADALLGAPRKLSAKTRIVSMPRSAFVPIYPATGRPIYAGASSFDIGAHWVVRWTGADPRGTIDLERLADTEPMRPDDYFACWL